MTAAMASEFSRIATAASSASVVTPSMTEALSGAAATSPRPETVMVPAARAGQAARHRAAGRAAERAARRMAGNSFDPGSGVDPAPESRAFPPVPQAPRRPAVQRRFPSARG
jgi:hypothetical protein